MGRVIKITAIVIICLLLLGFFGYTQIPNWLSRILSDKAGVEVSIDKVGISPSDISIDRVTVENPKGYQMRNALKIRETDIKAPLGTYLKDNIIIDEIAMNDVYLSIEFDSSRSYDGNWTKIMSNLSKGAEAENDSSSKHVLIKRLILTNITVDLYTPGSKQVQRLRPIKRLEFTNVTSSGGIPSAQITNAVMQVALREIFSERNIKNMLENILNPSNKEGFFAPFKDLFD